MQRIFRSPLFRTLVILVVALSGLGGCQSSLKNMIGLGPADGEAPSATGKTGNVDLAEGGFKAAIDSSRLIFVVPVQGAGGPAPLVLADAVAASLQDAGQPAILAKNVNEMGPTIVGRIDRIERRGSVVWVTAVWQLLAPYGTAVAEYRQQIVVDAGLWQAGAAEAINLLVFDAAPRVSAMVRNFVSPMAMPAGMGEIVTDAAAREQAALDRAEKEAAIRDPGAPGNGGKPVLAYAAPPQPQIKSRLKGPADQQAVATLTDKVAKVLKATPRVKRIPARKPKKKIGKPRVLLEIPDETTAKPKAPSKPKTRVRKKPVLMPVPEGATSPIVSDPPSVGWARPAFLIKKVTGAPGDGNKALTRSMKSAMRKNDLTVTEDPRQAGFVVVGTVELSTAVNGRQQARIVWTVNTVDGDEVGKAVQENAVKAGSLNGSWGRIADIVTVAAITGIQELFGIERKQTFRRRREIKFSGRGSAPQVPGRALPPP
jgi:hypothetical protein